jgi:hypothetical protein
MDAIPYPFCSGVGPQKGLDDRGERVWGFTRRHHNKSVAYLVSQVRRGSKYSLLWSYGFVYNLLVAQQFTQVHCRLLSPTCAVLAALGRSLPFELAVGLNGFVYVQANAGKRNDCLLFQFMVRISYPRWCSGSHGRHLQCNREKRIFDGHSVATAGGQNFKCD